MIACILFNPTWISAIAAFVVAIFTGFYVCYTAGLLEETKKSSLNQKMPILIFEPIKSVGSGGGLAFEESIINVGAGPAIDIQFESNGKFDGATFTGTQEVFLQRPLSVNVLGVHTGDPTTRTSFWKSDNGKSILLHEKGFKARVHYKDIFGRSFETSYENYRNEFLQRKN